MSLAQREKPVTWTATRNGQLAVGLTHPDTGKYLMSTRLVSRKCHGACVGEADGAGVDAV